MSLQKCYKFVLSMLLVATVLACQMKELNFTYVDSVIQSNYPSGSTISRFHDKIFIMGDDASELLVLTEDLKQADRIPLFPKGDAIRTPKALKADIEASVLIREGGKNLILLFGSGSLTPHRDSAFVIDPASKNVIRIDLSVFYSELRTQFRELNIEAAAIIADDLVLGLRGNTSHPDNFLVIASPDIYKPRFKRKILVKLPVDHAGISGMDYDESQDRLFITFSSEDTANAIDDGEVGESYLAVVSNARQQLKKDELQIQTVIKLSDLSADLLHQKIESVSLIKNKSQLLLVADDDNGKTTLFRIAY